MIIGCGRWLLSSLVIDHGHWLWSVAFVVISCCQARSPISGVHKGKRSSTALVAPMTAIGVRVLCFVYYGK